MPIDLYSLNKTELVACAIQLNPEVHRGLPVELLVAIIEGEEVELPTRFVNKKRLAIMQYINDNWLGVNFQLSCPAKTQDPYACFGCSDLQATCCTLDNSKKFLRDEDQGETK